MIENGMVSGAPLTTENAAQASPDLLSNAIDDALVKVRPMATPLDQISRYGQTRPVDAMEVDYYTVDTRADRDKVLSCSTPPNQTLSSDSIYTFTMKDGGRLEVSDTFLTLGADGVTHQFYVSEKTSDTVVKCQVLGTPPTGSSLVGLEIVRMGRAATQLDVQSPQFAALPQKATNYCQIFKMQVEQSIVMKLSHKEIGWDFSDQQEAAVYDMRLGMEKQWLFGVKGKVYDTQKAETVTLTGGIWRQTDHTVEVPLTDFTQSALVDMLKEVFAHNSGSRRKVLIAGSDLIAALNKIEHTHIITGREQVTKWGIDFSELQSKFGRLYVVYSQVFDVMGMPGNGMVIDPAYIQKHVFIPFNAQTLDLRGSGQRNTEAMVLTEASCLTLRYPDAHARVIGVKTTPVKPDTDPTDDDDDGDPV